MARGRLAKQQLLASGHDYMLYDNDPPTEHWEFRDAERLYRPASAKWLLPVALAFVVLNGADFVLTHLILEANHGVEANPIARLYVESLFLFMGVKLLYPATLAWRIVQHREHTPWERKPARVLVAWTVIFLLVVAWNAHVWIIR